MTPSLPSAVAPSTCHLAALLRRGPEARDVGGVDLAIVDRAVDHGVAPLLYRALADHGSLEAIDEAVRARLARLAREAALVEAVRSEDLVAVLATMEERGINPLLFKGAALALSHYSDPALRTRGDSDLLVRGDEVAAACGILEARGFHRLPRPRGVYVTQQSRYIGTWRGVELAYDVHWRVADPHAFADALPYDELEREAVRDTRVGGRRLADVHALLVACVHRAAHHYDSDHLMSLYDIDLLSRGLTASDWERFAGLAVARRLRAVCLRGLDLAAELLDSPIPSTVRRRLAGGELEPTARYVGGRLRRIDVLRSDLRELPSWRARIGLFREHLFPPAEYVVATAAGKNPMFSAALYLRRIARGAGKWFRPLH